MRLQTAAASRSKSRTRVALYEDVSARLRQKIYDYELLPGEWIDETALALELDISRTPLRESLKLLAAEGLVQMEPGRGCRVTKLTLEDLNELFPVMAMLEGRCAFEATHKLDELQMEELEQIHARLEAAAASGDMPEYYQHNYEFHKRVQTLAGNPWLIRVANDLRRILKIYRGRQLLVPGRMQSSLDEHRALMECFRQRDAAGAERTMNHHLERQRDALARYVADGGKLYGPTALTRMTG